MFPEVNVLAIIAVAIVNMLIGGLWYSSILFGKQWSKLMGWGKISKQQMAKIKKDANKGYAGEFINSLIMAWVFALFMNFFWITNIDTAMRIAGLFWAGFVFPVMMGSVFWENRPIKLMWINAGYRLVSMLVMSIILTVWV
jgi:hypothetical protein